MKKNVLVLFFTLFIGMVGYSQDKDNETIFKILIGSDFSTVDSVMKNKGFSMIKSMKNSSELTSYSYSGGMFANTEPQLIVMVVSQTHGLVACDIGWTYDYYLNLDASLDDDALNHYLDNNDNENALKRIAYKNKSEFGTLINSLEKKYGCKIYFPDYYEKFSTIVYSGKGLSIIYGFKGGNTIAECKYKLSFISKYYEGNISDDL